ncbi:MAG TPA: MarR family transcriptional regulator [Candidatus Polarisedimenticolia bacterium]|nr:MarR family transcriptional regulator [Candidatus Polarisedimenticolia bacterium]
MTTRTLPARRPPSPGRRRDARRLMAAIRALVRRFSISERADVSCCGMTVAQAATLEALRRERGMRLGALGLRLGITPSTLTRNLVRLEGRSLVARAADPGDARSARVVLTAAGRAVAARLERQEEAFAGEILERLPRGHDRRALSGLEDLLRAVRAATESCCPGAFDHLIQDFPRERSRARRQTP